MHFTVWDPKVCGEDDGADIPVGAEPWEALDAEDAAKVWAVVGLAHRDECTVHVRAPGGALSTLAVRAEKAVVYRVRPA